MASDLGGRGKRKRAEGLSLRPLVRARTLLFRQRVGAELEVVDLGLGALAALHVERRAAAGGGPDPLSLPAGGGIVDAPIHALDVETGRLPPD